MDEKNYMKVLYDHQIFILQKYGGISRYFAEIITNLNNEIDIEIALKYSNNEYIKQIKSITNSRQIVPKFNFFHSIIQLNGLKLLYKYFNKHNPFISIALRTFNKKISIEMLKKQNFDIFHPTYYDNYFLDYIGKKPFVLTIYDMIHELYPEMLKDTTTIRNKANLAKKAAHIIAISEQTKRDVIDILGIKEDKISVIHLASSMLKSSNNYKHKLPEKYLLFVGNRSNYKNFDFFVLAVSSILNKHKDLQVVCSGHSFNKSEVDLMKILKIEERFINLFIHEDQFYEVYKNAIAFIFPSYYEGFGIPILEAYRSECPVILSNSSCFPEIAGDAALFFSPKSKSQLIEAIELVLNDNKIKTTLVEKGKERLENYSWQKTSEKTIEVYKKVLNG